MYTICTFHVLPCSPGRYCVFPCIGYESESASVGYYSSIPCDPLHPLDSFIFCILSVISSKPPECPIIYIVILWIGIWMPYDLLFKGSHLEFECHNLLEIWSTACWYTEESIVDDIILIRYQGSNTKRATLFTFYNISSKILFIFSIAYIFLCIVLIWMLPFYPNIIWQQEGVGKHMIQRHAVNILWQHG